MVVENLIQAEQRAQEIVRAAAEGREPDFSNYDNLPTPGTFGAENEVNTETPVGVTVVKGSKVDLVNPSETPTKATPAKSSTKDK